MFKCLAHYNSTTKSSLKLEDDVKKDQQVVNQWIDVRMKFDKDI